MLFEHNLSKMNCLLYFTYIRVRSQYFCFWKIWIIDFLLYQVWYYFTNTRTAKYIFIYDYHFDFVLFLFYVCLLVAISFMCENCQIKLRATIKTRMDNILLSRFMYYSCLRFSSGLSLLSQNLSSTKRREIFGFYPAQTLPITPLLR